MFEYLVPKWWNYWEGLRGVALLEGVCFWRRTLRFQKAGDTIVPTFCILIMDQDVSTRLLLSPCLCSSIMVSNPLKS